jgi:hypothetical protein
VVAVMLAPLMVFPPVPNGGGEDDNDEASRVIPIDEDVDSNGLL